MNKDYELTKPYPAPPVSPGDPLNNSRRDLLIRMLSTSGLAVASVGMGAWLLNREAVTAPALLNIKDHRVHRSKSALYMAIARGKIPSQNVSKAMQAMGGMDQFIKPGDKVVIKPNVGWNRLPAQAANTNPDVVAEVVRLVKNAKAGEIWVTDVSVNNAEQCFRRSQIKKAASKAGAKVILPKKSGFKMVAAGGHFMKTAEVLWPFVEADKIINIPIVKQHSLSRATMSMKNWYGVIGGHRARLHQDIHRSIVDLARMVKPTLTILDATRVLMNNGPSGGSLDDVKDFDTIAISTDEVALDSFGAQFLNLNASDLEYVQLAKKAGLGISNYQNKKIEEISG